TRSGGVAAAAPPPVTLVAETTQLRQLSLPTYYAASMAALFLFLTAQMGLVSLFYERTGGTLRRILASPMPPLALLAGKTLGGFIQGLVAMVALVAATTV